MEIVGNAASLCVCCLLNNSNPSRVTNAVVTLEGHIYVQ